MPYDEQPPRWEAPGVEPPDSKKVEGWKDREKPPADYFNWLFSRIYNSIRELREKSAEKTDLDLTADADGEPAPAGAEGLTGRFGDWIRRLLNVVTLITGKTDYRTPPDIDLETVADRLGQEVNPTSSPTFERVNLGGDPMNMVGEAAPGRMVLRGEGGAALEGEIVARLQANLYHDGTTFQRWDPTMWSLMVDAHAGANVFQILRARPGTGPIAAFDYTETFATMTSGPITFYVRPDGNDANDGKANTAAGAFKTINGALARIPKLLSHPVTINVAAGTYAEDVVVAGFRSNTLGAATAGLTILAANSAAGMTNIQSALFQNCNGRFELKGFTATSTTKQAFDAYFSDAVFFTDCITTVAATGYVGFNFTLAKGRVVGGTVSNRAYGIFASNSSHIIVSGIAGTGNNVGMHSEASIIHYSGATPNGVVKISDSVLNGVINPWGDNTRNARPLALLEGAAAQTFVSGTWYVIKFNSELRDNLGNYDPATGNFTAPKTGTYQLIVGNAVYNLAAGWRVLGGIERNGVFYKFITDIQYGVSPFQAAVGSVLIDLSVGDTVRFMMVQTAGDGVNLDPNSQVTYMHIIQVA